MGGLYARGGKIGLLHYLPSDTQSEMLSKPSHFWNKLENVANC